LEKARKIDLLRNRLKRRNKKRNLSKRDLELKMWLTLAKLSYKCKVIQEMLLLMPVTKIKMPSNSN